LYTAGAANTSTREGGVAFLIKEGDQLRYIFAKHISDTTSNRAEYLAILFGLRRCRELGADEVEVYTDSELIIGQMEGYYGAKLNRDLVYALMDMRKLFKRVRFRYVRGEENPVHRLAHEAYQRKRECDEYVESYREAAP
jgi:ribonuclease HI